VTIIPPVHTIDDVTAFLPSHLFPDISSIRCKKLMSMYLKTATPVHLDM
jgi:hypothetical protein